MGKNAGMRLQINKVIFQIGISVHFWSETEQIVLGCLATTDTSENGGLSLQEHGPQLSLKRRCN
jgi:hypothetical protein